MYTTNIYLQTRSLPALGNFEVYEAWLVDADTTHTLSLGLLNPTSYASLASLNFEFDHYVHNYDVVMVTREPYPDEDPNPAEVVLVGYIPQVRMAGLQVSDISYYSR